MYKAQQKGIPTHEFRKQWSKDIKMINEIERIVNSKQKSIKQIEDFKLQAKGL